MVRRYGDALLVNPGSVGFPSPSPRRRCGSAVGGVRDPVDAEAAVRGGARRPVFDVQALVELILASGMPHGEWWADLWSPDDLARLRAACACGQPTSR